MSTDEPLPAAEMALLVAALASGQEASATAEAQAGLDAPATDAEPLLAPASGRFNAGMAGLAPRLEERMNAPFTAAFQGIFKLRRYPSFIHGEGAPRPDRKLSA